MTDDRTDDSVTDDARDDVVAPSAVTLAAVFWQRAVQGARLMVGVPDYDAYVAHLREKHPDVRPLTRDDFLRAAQAKRYGRGGSRCC